MPDMTEIIRELYYAKDVDSLMHLAFALNAHMHDESERTNALAYTNSHIIPDSKIAPKEEVA